jgi:hypothetical protein
MAANKACLRKGTVCRTFVSEVQSNKIPRPAFEKTNPFCGALLLDKLQRHFTVDETGCQKQFFNSVAAGLPNYFCQKRFFKSVATAQLWMLLLGPYSLTNLLYRKFGVTRDRCYDCLYIFAENIANNLAFFTLNKATTQKFDHNIGFQEKRQFFAENCRKTQKIVIITSTPDVLDCQTILKYFFYNFETF